MSESMIQRALLEVVRGNDSYNLQKSSLAYLAKPPETALLDLVDSTTETIHDRAGRLAGLAGILGLTSNGSCAAAAAANIDSVHGWAAVRVSCVRLDSNWSEGHRFLWELRLVSLALAKNAEVSPASWRILSRCE
jgi:hypothetical protein